MCRIAYRGGVFDSAPVTVAAEPSVSGPGLETHGAQATGPSVRAPAAARILARTISRARLLATGRAILRVRLAAAGRLQVRWRLATGGTVARAIRTVTRAGQVTLVLRLTAAGRRALRAHRRLRVREAVLFTPAGRAKRASHLATLTIEQ